VGKYGTLGSAFDRIFRNTLNKALDDVDTDINAQKKRVDDLITGTPQPSEVVDARGGFPVLSGRLDDLSSSVAQITSDGYVIADSLGLQKFNTEAEARANVSVNNAAKLQPYLDQGYKIKMNKGYYPFEKELIWGNNSIIGSDRMLANLVFPNSRGIVFGKNLYLGYLTIKGIGITSKGHCIDFRNDEGAVNASPYNIYLSEISHLSLYSEEGHCVYAGTNYNKYNADMLVFSVSFKHIIVKAPMGAGFYGMGGLGISYEFISDKDAIKYVFQNCHGNFDNVNTSFAGAEWFMFFDANCPPNYDVQLKFTNVNMEDVRKGGICIESTQIKVTNLVVNLSSISVTPTNGVLLTKAPIYIPDLGRVEVVQSNISGDLKKPEKYDLAIVKSPIHCFSGGGNISAHSDEAINVFSSNYGSVITWNKNYGTENSPYDYNFGKTRYKLHEEIHAKTLTGGRQRQVLNITDRALALSQTGYVDEYNYTINGTDLSMAYLSITGASPSRKITVSNNVASTTNIRIEQDQQATGFKLFGERALTLLPGESADFVYKNSRWVQVITADNLVFSKTTANRPTSPFNGQSIFDSTLGKPIWWSGTAWKDATGTNV
jgi:hypothetical protein